MRPFILIVLSVLLLNLATPARASQRVDYPENPIVQPNLVAFGLGYYDFDKDAHNKRSADMRMEYRWGTSLLPMLSSYFKSWDSSVQFHPFAGFETISRGSLYGLGGFDMDWFISRHWLFNWSEGAGIYYRGNGPRMGSFLQFRSQAELGWRFDNAMRLTAQFSHISDAKITRWNPGAEILGVYLQVPTAMIFGK